MKKIESDKIRVTVSVAFFIIGLLSFYWYYNENQVIKSYTSNNTTVTVIELPQSSGSSMTFPFALGVAFFLAATMLMLLVYLSRSRSNQSLRYTLTDQEKTVISLIELGKKNKEIATELSISPSTVKTHINNIYKKLGINSRDELMQMK